MALFTMIMAIFGMVSLFVFVVIINSDLDVWIKIISAPTIAILALGIAGYVYEVKFDKIESFFRKICNVKQQNN